MNRLSVDFALRDGKSLLKFAGIESWSLDAELLLMECIGYSREKLLTERDVLMPEGDAMERYKSYLRRRVWKEPIQYILNRCEFMSLEFYLTQRVLIPRPDTEILVEKSIDIIKERGYKNIFEMGTGSGCISVSLAYYLKDITLVAMDLETAALEVGRINAKKHGVDGRIDFRSGDGLHLNIYRDKKYDMFISNPPYISKEEIEELEDNVKKYEPRFALYGGWDGLNFYRSFAENLREMVRPGGAAAFEIGYNQGPQVSELLRKHGFEKNYIIKDLSGLDRVIITEVEY